MILEYKGESYTIPDEWMEEQKKESYNQAIEDFYNKLDDKGLLGSEDSPMWTVVNYIVIEIWRNIK